MVMNIPNIIKFKFPNSIELKNYIIQDNGNGPFINYWNESILGSQPTEKELTVINDSIEFQNYLKRDTRTERDKAIDAIIVNSDPTILVGIDVDKAVITPAIIKAEPIIL
jgi:hypothetical protein